AADGKAEVIGTDDSWLPYRARAWNRGVKEINSLVGSTEVYDANADPVDWMATEFDDSKWEEAFVIPPRQSDWSLLEARDVPMMREEEVFPVQVVETGEVIDQSTPAQVDIPELLNEEVHLPLENAVVKGAGELLRRDSQPAEFQSKFVQEKGIRAPYIIVDF